MSWKWQEKDYLDQPAHLLMGAWPTLFFGLLTNSLAVSSIVTLFNLGYLFRREFDQHNRWTFNLDLVFCLAGALLGNAVIAVYIFIISE